MNFTATNTNYAEQYQKTLANAYPYLLAFNEIRSKPGDGRYEKVDNVTIKIPVLKTSGRKNADSDSIHAASRQHNNAWETKTLTHHRYWKDLIAPADIRGTNEVVAIGNITRAYNEQQKFPEMDAYLMSKLYADFKALGGKIYEEALTEENVLRVFDEMYEARREAGVFEGKEILYVTSQVNRLIKSAIKRYASTTDGTLSRAITRIDDVTIKPVRSILMKTAYDFTEGWAPAESADQINMAFIDPSAVITPEFYSFVGLGEPTAQTDGKYVYYEESWDDVFILNERKDGISFHVTKKSA